MPTIFTHGIVGWALAARARGRRSLALASLACAMLPDLDYVGLRLSVQYNSFFGHRGFTHSIFFAALAGLAGALLLRLRARDAGWGFGKVFLLLFAATLSHPLLDAMTNGGEGVALLSPFSNRRLFFPWRPILVSPLGVEAFLSWRGLLVALDELVLVVVPVGVLLFPKDCWRWARERKAAAMALTAAWAAAFLLLQGLSPLGRGSLRFGAEERPMIELFAKQYRNPHVLRMIPLVGMRDTELVTSFGELQVRGLFNRMLEASDLPEHWASGFFPSWYGGIAGRWQNSNAYLFLRTLFGYGAPGSREIVETLRDAPGDAAREDFLFRLSPTEKYDLALGDYGFSATRSILAVTHNASELPKFWYGICNGMAAASKWFREPFRAVDVINPNGFRVRFHPNDVKALLGYSMANIALWTEVGTRCDVNGPEARACRINPGAFFLATMNRLGLAHDAFIVDGFSGTRKQFYLFDAARVEVLTPPTPVGKLRGWAVPTPVRYLAKVRFTMEFVSTLLGEKDSGLPETGNGFYKKVGRVVVPRVLEAMIALGEHGHVIGGAWLGDDDVPDVIFFPGATPATDENGRLRANLHLQWNVIQRLYQQSVRTESELDPLDFSL